MNDQSISTGPLRQTFTERLLTGDMKDTIIQVSLDIGIRAIDNFNPAEMTKHVFPTYAFRKQKRYLRRHLVKSRIYKQASGSECKLSINFSWHRRSETCTSTCRWNHGHHLPFHTRFQLRRLYHQRNDWFHWN